MKPFVNPVDMEIPVTRPLHTTTEKLNTVDNSALKAKRVLSTPEIQHLNTLLDVVEWKPVSITGMSGNYEPGDPIGSWRASSLQEAFARELWKRIGPHLPAVKRCDNSTNTDWDGTEYWRPIGVNPLLRFIKYTDGGFLVPHYDAPYVADENNRTLMSFVIYLNDTTGDMKGGETRFLIDPQKNTPVDQRILIDESKPASDDRVLLNVLPASGEALLFDHRILHESHTLHGSGEKRIIRTDVMYQRLI